MPPRNDKHKQRLLLSDLIKDYGDSPKMPCSNCVRYNRQCVVLGDRSQRCGECVRRGTRCDALQASVNDLQSLRLEEERLKLERDAAFESAMANLARVRELERRQQELRSRGMEMARRGLKSLDDLDAAEQAERQASGRLPSRSVEPAGPLAPGNSLFESDFSDPFWAALLGDPANTSLEGDANLPAP